MAELDAKTRASLPDRAFAYVDSKGKRRLPINDESHVRNAMARFNQVKFEDDASREKAIRKLLEAAGRYGIVPVGFVAGQLRRARSTDARDLPSGPVTLMLTDMERSTALVRCLGDRFPAVLQRVRELIGDAVGARGGYEVDFRADEHFAVFDAPAEAVETAVVIQTEMEEEPWPEGLGVRVRIGLHSGNPALTDTGYVGIAVNTTARIRDAGHGGQILVSAAVRRELGGLSPGDVGLRHLGEFQLRGLDESVAIFQVDAPGLPQEFPSLRLSDSG